MGVFKESVMLESGQSTASGSAQDAERPRPVVSTPPGSKVSFYFSCDYVSAVGDGAFRISAFQTHNPIVNRPVEPLRGGGCALGS
jgi:hypothetical protein